MMTITKSNYISCKQCEKLLWLEKYKPHVLDDKVTKQTAEGDAVGALARMYYQPNVTVKLDTVEHIIRSEPAVNQKPEPEDDWETVEVVQTAAGSHVTRRAFRHSACGELLNVPKPFCPNCGHRMWSLEKPNAMERSGKQKYGRRPTR